MRLQVEADDHPTLQSAETAQLSQRNLFVTALTGSNAGGSGHSGCGLNFGFDLLQA